MTTLFSSPKVAEPPAPEPVAPMPDPEAVALEKKKKLAKKLQSTGRASTFLTQYTEGTEKLGG